MGTNIEHKFTRFQRWTANWGMLFILVPFLLVLLISSRYEYPLLHPSKLWPFEKSDIREMKNDSLESASPFAVKIHHRYIAEVRSKTHLELYPARKAISNANKITGKVVSYRLSDKDSTYTIFLSIDDSGQEAPQIQNIHEAIDVNIVLKKEKLYDKLLGLVKF